MLNKQQRSKLREIEVQGRVRIPGVQQSLAQGRDKTEAVCSITHSQNVQIPISQLQGISLLWSHCTKV